ncbi:hypothetical protein HELRODRAFT_185790 [Helobdella robusta]|uniref:Zinc finger protein 313 n=1 Tax=Helobdella robusta TaxID=6412 RepID=T1FNA4_HELRO|nr:hypothetical protein HELRODRAFT_185790 [Helobdella robusta]ESO00022.1 hypothetical protein HELRODRAFT_185790 [Helobdella robusta]
MAASRDHSDVSSEGRDEFCCPLCLDIFETPVLIDCGSKHVFCSKCIYMYTDKSMTNHCPICRQVFNLNNSRLEGYLFNALKTCKTLCEGCRKMFILSAFKEHREVCVEAKNREAEQVEKLKINSPIHNAPNRHTFKCPYCHYSHLDTLDLVKHCNEAHANERTPVVCPVCVSMPWGDPNFKSINFIQHLNVRHRFEYDTYVDYKQDDDAMMQAAIEASLQDNKETK